MKKAILIMRKTYASTRKRVTVKDMLLLMFSLNRPEIKVSDGAGTENVRKRGSLC